MMVSSYAVLVYSSDSAESHSGDIEVQDLKHESSYGASDCSSGLAECHNGDISPVF